MTIYKSWNLIIRPLLQVNDLKMSILVEEIVANADHTRRLFSPSNGLLPEQQTIIYSMPDESFLKQAADESSKQHTFLILMVYAVRVEQFD